MDKELILKNNEITAEMAEEFKADFQIDSSDILIPKILLMQPSSEMVADQKAQMGDFMHSVQEKKIASITEPFEFLPFFNTKRWDIMDPENQNEWVRAEEFKPGDDNLPWEFVEDGKPRKRVKRLDFFGFIPKFVEAGEILPMILSFKSTGYREGTKILTQWKTNMEKRKVPFAESYLVGGEKKKNEKNQTYFIPEVRINKEVSAEMLNLCMKWYKDLKHAKVKVVIDESDNKEKPVEAAEAPQSIDTGRF